jgi:hypothetical protein
MMSLQPPPLAFLTAAAKRCVTAGLARTEKAANDAYPRPMTARRIMLALVATTALAAPVASSHAGPIRIAFFDCHRSVKHFGDYPSGTTLLVHGISCAEAHRLYLRMVAHNYTDPARYGRFRLRGLRRNRGGPIRENASFSCRTSQIVLYGVTIKVRCHDNFGDVLRLSFV